MWSARDKFMFLLRSCYWWYFLRISLKYIEALLWAIRKRKTSRFNKNTLPWYSGQKWKEHQWVSQDHLAQFGSHYEAHDGSEEYSKTCDTVSSRTSSCVYQKTFCIAIAVVPVVIFSFSKVLMFNVFLFLKG